MFTGIITAKAKYTTLHNNTLSVVVGGRDFRSVALGESVANDGVCLTVDRVVKLSRSVRLQFILGEETRKITTLASLAIGSLINLERSATLKTLFGGHLVYGHIDAVGKVIKCSDGWLSVQLAKKYLVYVCAKGSIAINGVSLTIAKINHSSVLINLIPHTLKKTNLSLLQIGDEVNVEFDAVNKYLYAVR